MSSTLPAAPEKLSRRKQFAQTYRMARKTDRALPWWILGTFLLGAALGFVVLWLLPGSGTI